MRRRGLRSAQLQIRNCKSQISQRGYILITLMLFVALLAIAAVAVLPKMAFQIKRDREEEMIHRAVAYSRAIKRYYKKFGRYPSRIEELENTNNVRFLRKRYQDPITGKDFKILHLSDVMQNSGPGLGLTAPQAGMAQSGGGTQLQLTLNSGGVNTKVTQDTAPTPPANAPDQNAQGSGAVIPDGQTSPNAVASSSSSSDTSSSKQQVFGGGGPILGVASTSKAKTIREFNDKKHYNEWLFVYDPTSDRGGLLNGPAQPNLNPGGQPGGVPGQVAPNTGQPQGGLPRPQGPPNPPQMPPDQ